MKGLRACLVICERFSSSGGDAAQLLDIQLSTTTVRSQDEYSAAFSAWRASRTDAVFVQPSLATDYAAAFALSHRSHTPRRGSGAAADRTATSYDLTLNLRTARALDISVPNVLMLLATEVIE